MTACEYLLCLSKLDTGSAMDHLTSIKKKEPCVIPPNGIIWRADPVYILEDSTIITEQEMSVVDEYTTILEEIPENIEETGDVIQKDC